MKKKAKHSKVLKTRLFAGILASTIAISTFAASSAVFAEETIYLGDMVWYEDNLEGQDTSLISEELPATDSPVDFEEPVPEEEAPIYDESTEGIDEEILPIDDEPMNDEISDSSDLDELINEDDELTPDVLPETFDEDPLPVEETEITDDKEQADGLIDEEETDEERAEKIRMTIRTAIEENMHKGLFGTLNAIFEALADSDAEVRDNNLEEIKGMIYEELYGKFDVTDEELHGAIGAAVERAKENGLIQVMCAGLLLGASSEKSEWNKASEYLKPIYEGALEAIVAANPELKPLMPILKYLGGCIFSTGSSDHTAEILEELRKMETQIKTAENDLKDHIYNVVALADIGDKYNTIKSKAATIRTLIKDIDDNPHLAPDEKLQQKANLYKDSEFHSLMSAMNGGTDCFFSNTNDIFETNIFDAAYNRACEEVMFSGEAIDTSMHYIFKQFVYYAAAYAAMAEVYDAYEKCYGEGSLNGSRRDMVERMCGTDLNGNNIGPSVADRLASYFRRDRFIFVGKSNRTKIPVLNVLYLRTGTHFVNDCIDDPYSYLKWSKTPSYVSDNLLTTDQLKNLAEYCKQKGLTLFDYLFNVMHFEYRNTDDDPFIMTTAIGSPTDPVWCHRGTYYVPTGGSIMGKVYLATGKSIKKDRNGDGCRLEYEAVDATAEKPSVTNVRLASGTLNARLGILSHTYYYNTPIFFQRRGGASGSWA